MQLKRSIEQVRTDPVMLEHYADVLVKLDGQVIKEVKYNIHAQKDNEYTEYIDLDIPQSLVPFLLFEVSSLYWGNSLYNGILSASIRNKHILSND